MINLTSERAKLQYQKSITREMMVLERQFAKGIGPILGRQYLDTASLVESNVFNVNAPVLKQGDRLYSLFVLFYMRIVTIFVKEVMDKINEEKGVSPSNKKDDLTVKEEFYRLLTIWLKEESAKKVVRINNTTRSLLQKIIDKGMKENKNIREIARDIRIISGITNPYRALTIARTETHTAAVYSIDKAITSTGYFSIREWMSANDERVRRPPESDFDHVVANGERVGVDEKFIKTGEPLDYPGDSKGSPGNIINCRCVLLYYTAKKAMEEHKRKMILGRNI